MDNNIYGILQQELNKSRTNEQSLSDRLSSMDKYNSTVTPVIRAQTLDFSNRPVGYNPLNDIASAVDISEKSRTARSAVSQDYENSSNRTLSLLSQLASLSNQGSGRATQADDKFYSAVDNGIEQLKQGEDWGTVWSRIKQRFPDRSAQEIDQSLGTKWRQPGAFQSFVSENTKPTSDQINRREALKPAQQAIDSIDPAAITKAGPQNRINKILLSNLGGIGVSQDIVGTNQKFELLKQSVVRALQGARMSDKDIEQANTYMPDITDTPDTVKTKLTNLKAFLSNLSGESSQPSGGGGGNSDPLGIR